MGSFKAYADHQSFIYPCMHVLLVKMLTVCVYGMAQWYSINLFLNKWEIDGHVD